MKLTGKERMLLISAPLMTSLLLMIRHYKAMPDSWYGFFAGLGLGLGIFLLIKIVRRKRRISHPG